MVGWTLLLDALLAAGGSMIYGWIGERLLTRRVSPGIQRASTMFAVWWFGVAGATLAVALSQALGAFGVLDLGLHIALAQLALLALVAGLWGLLYYLVFLFTGSRRAFAPLGVFYGALYVGILWLLVASGPVGVVAGRWRVAISYASPIEGPVAAAFAGALLLPVTLAAMAYFSLFFRLTDPEPRYRVAVVGLGVVTWLVALYLTREAALAGFDAGLLAGRAVGLLAAAAVFFGYSPPAPVRRWLESRGASPG